MFQDSLIKDKRREKETFKTLILSKINPTFHNLSKVNINFNDKSNF